jgi:methylated-DNA-[protein]-cysteine S-methyltransferase
MEWTLFDTAIGTCGIAWNGGEVTGVQLPERDDRSTRARIRRRWPGATEAQPSSQLQGTIDQLCALLRGEPVDLSPIPVNLDGVAPFNRLVYQIARAIPRGETLSYGEVAKRAGDPGAARAVGRAMAQNPVPLIVPCHRVVAAGGRPGGFSGGAGTATKLRLLQIEGASLGDQPDLFE